MNLKNVPFYLPEAHPVKIQICAVCSESSLGAFRRSKDAKFLYLDNEDYV